MIQVEVQHDELTTRGEITEADDANDAQSSTKRCPMSRNGTVRREEESVVGDAVAGDEQGFYFDMDEEDDEELYKMLEENVVNPNDIKAQNIIPKTIRTKVSH